MWLDVLKEQVESTSLSSVANAMGVSKTMISQVINGKYPGNLERVQGLVESMYMGHTVECPVLGEIPKHKCAAHQAATHVGSSPQAIRLWKACRSGCQHSQLEERLSQPVRLTQTPSQVQRMPNAERSTERAYDAQAVCARLERQAKTDAETTAGSYHRLYIDLLKRELVALGNRYNRQIKK
ncbi:transcriptional regulator [Grimontia hollisae]|uniref:transcriptional regulator n=1 Tax=Grimontia hollisae TaxID=673 RepID=UPI000DFC91E4|nr:transcriptional regulator [Grimontia hollisae]STQ75507.1 Uncharacterised protein [Grimontia hollisae]